MLLGATGTVGQATLAALLEQGHLVTCFIRPRQDGEQIRPDCFQAERFSAVEFRFGDVTQETSIRNLGFRGEAFDAVVSCLASRTGVPDDAWAIDYQAHAHALQVAKEVRVKQFVLLSAICVQKPKLAFQHAKLAFEKELSESGLTFSIVRPTALFKSLSGQIKRLRKGKSFLVFGDGTLTACKPISDKDLGKYLVQCLVDLDLHNRILPIGGPGPAITPKQQGEMLFALLNQKPHFTHVPVALLDIIVKSLSMFSIFSSAIAGKAELARIGKYYATESMLVYDTASGRYDAEATPSTGIEEILQFYTRLIRTGQTTDLGDHSVF